MVLGKNDRLREKKRNNEIEVKEGTLIMKTDYNRESSQSSEKSLKKKIRRQKQLDIEKSKREKTRKASGE